MGGTAGTGAGSAPGPVITSSAAGGGPNGAVASAGGGGNAESGVTPLAGFAVPSVAEAVEGQVPAERSRSGETPEEPEKSPSVHEDISQQDLERLEATPTLQQGIGTPSAGWGQLNVQIYNGLAGREIDEITVEISVVSPQKEILVNHRLHRMTGYAVYGSRSVPPLQTSTFTTSLGFSVLPGQSWSCRLVGAKGTRPVTLSPQINIQDPY